MHQTCVRPPGVCNRPFGNAGQSGNDQGRAPRSCGSGAQSARDEVTDSDSWLIGVENLAFALPHSAIATRRSCES